MHLNEKIKTMKTRSLYPILAFLFTFSSSFCDVIPESTHYVNKCVLITNLDEYPEISLVGYVCGPMDNFSYLITDSDCLHKGYKHNEFRIYAVLKTYLVGKDIENMNFAVDENALISNCQVEPYGSYVPDSDPTDSIQEFFKIMGFTNNSVILFKWKEIIGYNNGTANSENEYTFSGDVSMLSQSFPNRSNLEDRTKYGIYTKLYPNPNTDHLILKINNTFLGEINVDIYSLDGQIIKSYLYSKSDLVTSYTIPTGSLMKGNYIVRLQYGGVIESHRLVVD